METKKELHLALVHLKHMVMRDYPPRGGICCAVHDELLARCGAWTAKLADEMLEALFKKWPAVYKGDGAHSRKKPDRMEFPVGGLVEYQHNSAEKTLWENPRRIELLNWLIEQTKECEEPE